MRMKPCRAYQLQAAWQWPVIGVAMFLNPLPPCRILDSYGDIALLFLLSFSVFLILVMIPAICE
jgi:hypothetical protein